MTHYLPADNARCNGTDCPRRDTCLRYLCRNTGHERTPFFAPDPNNCDSYLEANTNERISTNDE
jgi:hypothetical protein